MASTSRSAIFGCLTKDFSLKNVVRVTKSRCQCVARCQTYRIDNRRWHSTSIQPASLSISQTSFLRQPRPAPNSAATDTDEGEIENDFGLRRFSRPSLRWGRSLSEINESLEVSYQRAGLVKQADAAALIVAVERTANISLASLQVRSLIRLFGLPLADVAPQKRLHMVESLWHALHKKGVSFDISHYNALASVYVELEHDFDTADFLAKLVDAKLQPNTGTYRQILLSCAHKGDMTQAGALLNEMIDEGLGVNDEIFNALLFGYARLNDHASVTKLMTMMQTKNLTPDDETYGHILLGYASGGNIEKIKEIAETVDSQGVAVLRSTVVQGLFLMTRNGHVKLITEFLKIFNQGIRMLNPAMALRNLVYFGMPEEALMATAAVYEVHKDTYHMAYWRSVARAELPDEVVCRCIDLASSLPDAYNPFVVASLFRYYCSRIGILAYEKALRAFINLDKDAVNWSFFLPLLVKQAAADDLEGLGRSLSQMCELDVLLDADCLAETFWSNSKRTLDEVESVIKTTEDGNVEFFKSLRTAYVAHCLENGEAAEARRVFDKFRGKDHIFHYYDLLPYLVAYTHATLDFSIAEIFLKPENSGYKYAVNQVKSDFVQNFLSLDTYSKHDLSEHLFIFLDKIGVTLPRQYIAGLLTGFARSHQNIKQSLLKLERQIDQVPLAEHLERRKTVAQLQNEPLRVLEARYLKAKNAEQDVKFSELNRLLHGAFFHEDKDMFEKYVGDDPRALHQPDMIALALKMYCSLGDLENALKFQDLMSSIESGFLNWDLVFQLTELYLKRGKAEEAVSFLRTSRLVKGNAPLERRNEFLTRIAVAHSVDQVMPIVEALLEHESTKSLAGEYYAHIVNNVPEGSPLREHLDRCTRIYSTSGVLPKGVIMLSKLLPDKDLLNEAVGFIKKVKGKKTSGMELAVAHVIAGNTNRAVNLLQNVNLTIKYVLGMAKFLYSRPELADKVIPWLSVALKIFDSVPMNELIVPIAHEFKKNSDYQSAIKLYEFLERYDCVFPSTELLDVIAEICIAAGHQPPFQSPAVDTGGSESSPV